jgi:uncharacterized NAD(P)/FAD-binding protein YdhS
LATGGDQLTEVDVAIVGGGFSGIAVAGRLARLAPQLKVVLFERRDAVGPGVAYSTPHPAHLTNSRAAKMSAFEDDPEHFVRWLAGRGAPDEFVPRRLYGEYLRSVATSLERPDFMAIRATVSVIEPAADGRFRVETDDGSAVRARTVVLATGNLESETAGIPPALLLHPRFIADPYRARYEDLRGDVLIVGSGLSGLDAIVGLEAAGFTGTIHTLSRRGLFPLPDVPVATFTGQVDVPASGSALRTLRDVRRFVREGQAAGYDWRALVEALRREVPRLWEALDARERGRFVRHAQRYWSVHRHRAPDHVDALRKRLVDGGRLIVHRGRLLGIDRAPVGMMVRIGGRDGEATFGVANAINAHGPTGDYRRTRDPLMRRLIASGSIAPAPFALGLIESRPGLFLAGPAERWTDYESTGVPELRRKAAELAERVVRHLDGSPPS